MYEQLLKKLRNVEQAVVFMCIINNPHITMNKLSDLLGVKDLSDSVYELEEIGLIRYEGDSKLEALWKE